MTDEEIRKYINGQPTIEGIVKEMKTWWSNEGERYNRSRLLRYNNRVVQKRKQDK